MTAALPTFSRDTPMSTFELSQQTAKLLHINPRTERHGDEEVPAADLKIEIIDSNEILSMFHPTLRSFLYVEEDTDDQLEGIEPRLTKLRFSSLLERLTFDTALKGADVTISFGLGGSSDIELQTVDVDKFRCTLMEGGSVGLVFRIKAQPTGEQIKKLYEVLGSEITLTVVPAIEKQGSLGLPVEA